MKTNLLKMMRRHHKTRYLQLQWVKSIKNLGDKWLLASKVTRKVAA